MKIIALIFTVLVVVTMTHGINREALQKFRGNYVKCSKMLGIPIERKVRIELALCTAIEEGLIYSNGDYDSDTAISKLKKFISDPIRLRQALNLYKICDEKATASGATGILKSLKQSVCAGSVINLLD